MKFAVRYYSKSGNTKKVADAIAEAIGVKAEEVSVPLSEETELVFLGSAVYAAGVDDAVKTFIKDNATRIGILINFSTAAVLSSTFAQVKKLADEHGVHMVTDEFHCRGAFMFMHRGRPNANDLKKAAAFAKQMTE